MKKFEYICKDTSIGNESPLKIPLRLRYREDLYNHISSYTIMDVPGNLKAYWKHRGKLHNKQFKL